MVTSVVSFRQGNYGSPVSKLREFPKVGSTQPFYNQHINDDIQKHLNHNISLTVRQHQIVMYIILISFFYTIDVTDKLVLEL